MKFDHLKNIKSLLNQQLKKHGLKLPKHAELKDLEIISMSLANKIDIDIKTVIDIINSRADKACIAANKVAAKEGK